MVNEEDAGAGVVMIEIAHNIHEVGFTMVVFDCARLPKIDMKDI